MVITGTAAGYANAAFYDIDLRDIVTVDSTAVNPADNPAQSFTVSSAVDAQKLLACLKAGKTARVLFLDNYFLGQICCVELTAGILPEDIEDGGAFLSGVYVNNYRSVVAQVKLTVLDSGAALFYYYPNTTASFVKTVNGAGPDENGNVAVSGGGEGGGTVTSVNGVAPDENGNVALPIPGGTVKSVNGNEPDENGDVQLTIPAGTVTSVDGYEPDETGAVVRPNTTSLVIDWDAGTITETLEDGSSYTTSITFDDNGNVTAIGSMSVSLSGV